MSAGLMAPRPFMINGDRCTRACGFCLDDTSHPLPLDASEPERVGLAVTDMKLSHAVVTAVARDDLADGGAGAFAETIAAIRGANPHVPVLRSSFPISKGTKTLWRSCSTRAPMCSITTWKRCCASSERCVLQLLMPEASRSWRVRATRVCGPSPASSSGWENATRKYSARLADLASVGVEILTLGQYLRPSAAHLPVARFVTPEQFEVFGQAARALGFSHVESSPLTRSSYHARQAVEHATSDSVSA